MSETPFNGYLRFPVKLFEVRDRATFMPMMAVRLLVRHQAYRYPGLAEITNRRDAFNTTDVPNQFNVNDELEQFLLRRAGYGLNEITDHGDHLEPYVMFIKLDGAEAHYDPFEWRNRRTTVAHLFVRDNWSTLTSGQVIDVEHILGETAEPKVSEHALGGH